MVSIESKRAYLRKSLNSPKFRILFEYIFQNTEEEERNYESPDSRHFHNLVSSLDEVSSTKFLEIFENYVRRVPSNESPYVYDDSLLFILIVGCLKFDLPTDWIEQCLNLRSPTDAEALKIHQTLTNLAKKNYESTDNEAGVLVFVEKILGRKIVSDRSKKAFYRRYSSATDQLYQNELFNLLLMRSYDIMILDFDKGVDSDLLRLREFEKKFIKRVEQSFVFFYTVIILLSLFFIWRFVTNDDNSSIVENIDNFSGIAGFSVLSILYFLLYKLKPMYTSSVFLFFNFVPGKDAYKKGNQ